MCSCLVLKKGHLSSLSQSPCVFIFLSKPKQLVLQFATTGQPTEAWSINKPNEDSKQLVSRLSTGDESRIWLSYGKGPPVMKSHAHKWRVHGESILCESAKLTTKASFEGSILRDMARHG